MEVLSASHSANRSTLPYASILGPHERNGVRAAPVLQTLSIVIPAHDEAARLPRTLAILARWCERNAVDAEVIVVDDGSSDDTARLARNSIELLSRLRVIRHDRRRGKGAAVRSGLIAATAPFVLFTDADLSTPLEDSKALLDALEGGADLAVGSRVLPASTILGPQPWPRRIAGAVFRALTRALVTTGVSDTQCGMKAVRRSFSNTLIRESRVDGFAFDVEWLAIAQRRHARVVELPVRWEDRRGSRLRLHLAAREMFLDLLRLAWRFRPRPALARLPFFNR